MCSSDLIVGQVGNRDKCVSFRWGGDLVEAAAAISCGAALAKLTDGIFYDPDADCIFTADTVLDGVQDYLAGLA